MYCCSLVPFDIFFACVHWGLIGHIESQVDITEVGPVSLCYAKPQYNKKSILNYDNFV